MDVIAKKGLYAYLGWCRRAGVGCTTTINGLANNPDGRFGVYSGGRCPLLHPVVDPRPRLFQSRESRVPTSKGCAIGFKEVTLNGPFGCGGGRLVMDINVYHIGVVIGLCRGHDVREEDASVGCRSCRWCRG